MKLKTLIASAALLLMTFAQATIASAGQDATVEGGHTGNGGGGIVRNGHYLTFYSAGFYFEPTEATTDDVPQLTQLMDFFMHTPVMSEVTKMKFSSNLMPSASRNYYRVTPTTFTPEVKARVLDEYSRRMNVERSQLTLFAITETKSKTTYFFPEFYKLTPIEQQAILFHEAYWLVYPTATYDQVVKAEMSFQAYLTAPTNPERLLRWLNSAGSLGDVLTGALRYDLANNTMKGLISNGRSIPTVKLLGAETLNCFARSLGTDCIAFVAANVYNLTKLYPKSLFIKLLFDKVSRGLYTLGDNTATWESYYVQVIQRSDLAFYNFVGTKYSDSRTQDLLVRALEHSSFDFSAIGYSSNPSIPMSQIRLGDWSILNYRLILCPDFYLQSPYSTSN